MELGSTGVRLFVLRIRLDDFLWFASNEWGNDNETAPVLHGYALSFGLGRRERLLASGGVPTYEEDLRETDIYCTPGRLTSADRGRQRAVFTFNSVDNPTQLTQALRIGDKVNDPKFGRRQVLVPGLTFELVAFLRNEAVLPRVFRLGKKRSPAVVEGSTEVVGRTFWGTGTPMHAINPLDVSGRVTRCIPRAIPPHMVYERAAIEDDEFVRSNDGLIHIPKRVLAWGST